MKKLLFTALVAGLALLAWHPGNGVHAAHARGPMRAVLVDATDVVAAGAPVRIDAIAVEEDALAVDVSYPGGCKVHDFKLAISDGPDVIAAIDHHAYGDACESTVRESLRFDLSATGRTFTEARVSGDRIALH